MHHNYKYQTVLKPQDIGFLQYYMLPESNQFDYVYRPSDDSFLLLSVLKQQLHTFPSNLTLCQVGSGSGILSAHLNYWLRQNPPLLHISTDISLDACMLSQKYYRQYNLQIQQICTSFLSSLKEINPQIIIFNPPYVPTQIQEKENQMKYLKNKLKSVRETKENQRSMDTNLIAFSYMGGPDGLETTRKFIQTIDWQTRLYFIVMGEEGVQKLQEELEGLLDGKVQGKLQILQFYHKHNEELFVMMLTTWK